MSKTHLTALVSALLFLRWLATGHVAADGRWAHRHRARGRRARVAAAVGLIVYRTRAERAMLAAWQTRKAATR